MKQVESNVLRLSQFRHICDGNAEEFMLNVAVCCSEAWDLSKLGDDYYSTLAIQQLTGAPAQVPELFWSWRGCADRADRRQGC